MGKEKVISVNLDANEGIFFARELEHIKAKAYDIKYPQLKGASGAIIPISTEAGAGAESITYRQYDMVGMAKIIADYADDLPRADVKGKEFTAPVRGIGESYGYNLQEVRASNMTGKALPTRRATAARRANDQKVNEIAFFARPSTHGGLYGLFYNPNITVSTVPTRGGRTTWISDAKTPDEILADLNEIVSDIIDLTKGVEEPNTIMLPYAEYQHIASTPRSANSDTSILKYFLGNNGYVNRVLPVNECKQVNPKPSGGGAANLLVCLRTDPDNLTLEIPQPFEQLPVQERGLEFVIPCHSRCGGVIIYYPLSIAIYEGI